MTSRAKARAARMQALLNNDGTVTPAAQLPDGLLTQEIQLEAEYSGALLVADIYDNLYGLRLKSVESEDQILLFFR